MDTVEDFLEHFGVKGMRWGVRKAREVSAPQLQRHTKTGKIRVVGGKGQPAHNDAKRAAILGQVAKASGTHALSNDEMKLLLTRLDLESRYSKLNPPKKNAAVSFTTKLLAEVGNQELRKVMKGDLSTINQIEAALSGKPRAKGRRRK